MPGIYRPRHPERTVLYRVPFHNFDRFLVEYEARFEREYGYFRPIVQEGLPRLPSKGWAEMIRKVYEVDPRVCPRCGGRMKVVAWSGSSLCAMGRPDSEPEGGAPRPRGG